DVPFAQPGLEARRSSEGGPENAVSKRRLDAGVVADGAGENALAHAGSAVERQNARSCRRRSQQSIHHPRDVRVTRQVMLRQRDMPVEIPASGGRWRSRLAGRQEVIRQNHLQVLRQLLFELVVAGIGLEQTLKSRILSLELFE